MSDWKQRLQALLMKGKKPSYEELEEALAGALQERSDQQQIVREMSVWLGRLTHAFIQGDDKQLMEIMGEFFNERVQQIPSAPATTH